MRLYAKSELRDSRIFFDQKPPLFLTVFIIFIILLLCFIFIVSAFLNKNYIIEAQGIITTSDNVFIGALSDGVVVEVKKSEGEIVQKDDILFTISNGNEGLQYQAILKQVDNVKQKIKDVELYIESLNINKNLLTNDGAQQEYYTKMQYYLSMLKNEVSSSEKQNKELNQKKNTKEKLQQEIQILKDQILSLESQVNELEKQLSDDKNSINDLQNLKSELESKRNNLKIKESELSSLQNEIDQSTYNANSQVEQLKFQMISEAGSKKTSLQTNLIELEAQLQTYESIDKLYEVKATKEGYVHYLTPLKQGVAIQKTQTIAEVSENKEQLMQVEAYINAQDISKVKLLDDVKVALNGVNTQKFGTLSGKIVHIDAGTITQQTSNGNILLYRCIVEIDDKELSSSKGEIIKVVKSMPVVARIIYDKETFLEWFLELLNFRN